MTEAQMREAVSATFKTAWPAASGNVPFAVEDEAATLPSVDAGGFALQTTILTASTQRTMGGPGIRRVQRLGWIQVKLWSPADAGMTFAARLADAVRTVLEMVDIASPLVGEEPLNTQAAAAPMPGVVDGRWYMSLVRIPFWYSETK